MNITIDELLRIIGALYVELQMLRTENARLKAVVTEPSRKHPDDIVS